MSNLNNSKTRDIHDLDGELIKYHRTQLLKPITHLVNMSIQTKTFPESWKKAIISPIYKSGEPDLTCNYRPIAILPVVSKILEKVVAEQVILHLETNHLLHQQQFGFRPKHSTETAKCYLIEKIKCFLDKGHVVGGVFLDLKKAFNTVNHNVLLSKLSKFQFSDQASQWFDSYLSGRVQCVRVSGQKSIFRNNSMGIPQGSVLGPLLFSMYINDLPEICPAVGCQMYADDTVIYTPARSARQSAAHLNDSLHCIAKWLESSNLTLNITKTVSICFSMLKQRDKETILVKINNETINVVEDVKYLGIVLDSPTIRKTRRLHL
uniref:Reverse transcriptase domain-containing protein n=1 Tax=Labrus bergylta TaxID=56723 RepID=A0A3Q3MI54_9LABR